MDLSLLPNSNHRQQPDPVSNALISSLAVELSQDWKLLWLFSVPKEDQESSGSRSTHHYKSAYLSESVAPSKYNVMHITYFLFAGLSHALKYLGWFKVFTTESERKFSCPSPPTNLLLWASNKQKKSGPVPWIGPIV